MAEKKEGREREGGKKTVNECGGWGWRRRGRVKKNDR